MARLRSTRYVDGRKKATAMITMGSKRMTKMILFKTLFMAVGAVSGESGRPAREKSIPKPEQS
jgi:hypothetical protein